MTKKQNINFYWEVYIYKNINWKEEKIEKIFDSLEEFEQFEEQIFDKENNKINFDIDSITNKVNDFINKIDVEKIKNEVLNWVNEFFDKVEKIVDENVNEKKINEKKEKLEEIKETVSNKFNSIVKQIKEKIK